MKNKQSAEILLQTIERFSKISGLEVNRSKSECLIMNFELDATGAGDQFLGVPLVDNLKVLGHYHGKSKLICDYQNFYSKVQKITNILNMWKQRHLTIFGKNLLINSLINSQFIFNAQIDSPPYEFLKIVEKLNKDFLWSGGTPKIAHHSVIAEYKCGGFKYKDLSSLINSINLKFVFNMSTTSTENYTALPKMWIKSTFNIPFIVNNVNQAYFKNFFSNLVSIIDCKLKIPRQKNWKGHPFYYEILKTFEKISCETPTSIEDILSIPIWYNKFLKTKFDVELSRAGFNFVRDLFPGTLLISLENVNVTVLSAVKRRLLISIILEIPECWGNGIEDSPVINVTVSPRQTIHLNGYDSTLLSLSSSQVYSELIKSKTRLPTGLLRWCEDIALSDLQIQTAFTFTKDCCSSIFDRVFQYKINTRILPTNDYLKRYQVRESDACTRCQAETADTVLHSTWLCGSIQAHLTYLFSFLRNKCDVMVDISMINYLFGFQGTKFQGLNHILLEFKKHIFYSWEEDASVIIFFEEFRRKIQHIIVKEKQIALNSDNFATLAAKWEKFTEFYDFFGPDCQITY